jgi:hypothetical protein
MILNRFAPFACVQKRYTFQSQLSRVGFGARRGSCLRDGIGLAWDSGLTYSDPWGRMVPDGARRTMVSRVRCKSRRVTKRALPVGEAYT